MGLQPQNLTSLCTEEARTWDAHLLFSTYLDSYLLGWLLQSFPHVLSVIREPLLEPPCSHILYHTPTNRLDVTSAHILLRFARLLVGDTGSPRVRGTKQVTFAMESDKSGSAGPIWTLGRF
jgi:hypothetical protein